MTYFISLVLFITITELYNISGERITDEIKVCSTKCHGSKVNGTATALFCAYNPELTLTGRCCLNGTQVLGIDLHKCNLVEESVRAALFNLSNLKVISLEGNNLPVLNASIFGANTAIANLSIPFKTDCPGGMKYWEEVEVVSASVKICRGELNICKYLKVTCPANSHCVHTGFMQSECHCDEGYFGYKCMKSGVFPTTVFLTGLVIPSIILCILLWCSQRRYVKTSTIIKEE